jgi:sugar phosphate isomerase/epimerase
MWRRKICIDAGGGAEAAARLEPIKAAGFDGYFLNWKRGADLSPARERGEALGLFLQSVHAPFRHADRMWTSGPDAEDAVAELTECLGVCAELGAPIMVAHAFIGFDSHDPTPEGVVNYRRVADEAERLGIKLALENTEGEEYLAALMDALADHPAVGFCWDTGHEMCYNHSRDMLKRYGDRLLCTHLDDNLGITDYEGKITWLDDLHLLPFDGIADWDGIARRLCAHRFEGPLTFELNTGSKPGRHDNDRYGKLPPEEYYALAYAAACRVASLVIRYSVRSPGISKKF